MRLEVGAVEVWSDRRRGWALTQSRRGRSGPQRWRLLGGSGWGVFWVCFGHSERP